MSVPKPSRPVSYSDQALQEELTRLRLAWERLQHSRNRDAVYRFLTEIFDVVGCWVAEKRAINRARRALAICRLVVPEDIQPFAAMIVVAAHPTKLDRRTVSRWSRVLRYAQQFKLAYRPLGRFIRRNGGINAVAALYARRLGRHADLV